MKRMKLAVGIEFKSTLHRFLNAGVTRACLRATLTLAAPVVIGVCLGLDDATPLRRGRARA